MNKYTYSHNNPISYYVPTGHSIKSILENTVKKIKETVKVAKATAKAVKPVVEQTFKAAATVAINTEVKNILSPIAKIVKYAENKTQNVRNQYQLALAIGKGEAFPQLMNISANYSQGMYDTIGSQINGFMQFYDNPVQTAGSSLSYFLSDPLKNNPIYGIYQYGKDFKKAVSAHDWDTASYKLGVGVVNTAEVAASIAIGGKIGGKIPTSKVSVPKVSAVGKIRNAIDNFGTPALAGANGMMISGAAPIEASISSATVASASGVVAGAAVGQNVVYSYDQLSGRGALQESFSTGGNDKSSPKKIKRMVI